MLAAYALMIGTAALAARLLPSGPAQAILLGATLPGAGFLNWAAGDQLSLALALSGAGLLGFALALLLWFATGNLIAPIAWWIILAGVAGYPGLGGLDGTHTASVWPWLAGPLAWLLLALAGRSGRKTRPAAPSMAFATAASAERSAPPELSLQDLQRLRLLLDRALQPEDRFDGFEWRDQFQTAAIRYQVNFTGYALALAQRHYAPAADACFAEAQRRLRAKIGDHRLWRYWRLENAWGNLRLGADPVADQNIMYSGFTALQIAVGGGDELVLRRGGREWRRYGLGRIAEVLEAQYRASPYGLLACEPNWIYPLCNLITMAGIRVADARLGTDIWPQRSAAFLESLRREGMRADGSFVAFRSSLTGFAPPTPGGIVMQAFPCLFLNALSPDHAQEHWQRVRRQLDAVSWRRLFWPVDVGNYGFSRASGYAATAAAAVEMGDSEVAAECLRRLEAECPSRTIAGTIHRERASLWAHALELAARCNRQDGLRAIAAHPPRQNGPRLVGAAYPDVLVARAVAEGGRLDLVLYPGGQADEPEIALGNLVPHGHYRTGLPAQPFLRADQAGRATIRLSMTGRTSLCIEPVL